ncbi:putative hydrolase [Gordonia effusa NBRC 100432]|uniref:Putative hydrolase n=1 Tax=Gordonia effusa NBRC 100432 TaxID=1077974 RepID=H0R4W4_9ACTN|nr:CocE/NonD family hydrolase [Gordonia effusa]GAB20115.1 putative hydrolase [Gordonia effusa NBRC 100432]
MTQPESPPADTQANVSPTTRFDIGPRQYPHRHVDRGAAIRLSDGTVLSADITRPATARGKPVEGPLPTVVTFTPYNKMAISRGAPLFDLADRVGPLVSRVIGPTTTGRAGPRELIRALGGGGTDVLRASQTLVSRGYAYVMIDVRGTGSSTGIMEMFSEREQQDSIEALEWVRNQPWCNGDLALSGISYSAIVALQAAGNQPEGLKAVFAVEGSADVAKDWIQTGGAQSVFTIGWLAVVNFAKWAPSIPALLRAGVASKFIGDRFRSPLTMLGTILGMAVKEDHIESFYNADAEKRPPKIEDIKAATWIHGGWHDIFARSNTEMFERLSLAKGQKQLVIDDAYHLNPGAGFGTDDHPQRLNELQCAFFDRWLQHQENGIDSYGPVTLRELGTGDWLTQSAFPHPQAQVERWYLSGESSGAARHAAIDGSLGPAKTPGAVQFELPRRGISFFSYATNVTAMGALSMLGSGWFSDNRSSEASSVSFTSKPLTSDLQLSGYLNLHLRVLAHGTEAFWAVTVCDVAPDGSSAVVTAGALRSTRRAVDEIASLRVNGQLVRPEHPLTELSLLPVIPDEPHDLDIELNATAAFLPAGHRLRVAVTRTSWPRHLLGPKVNKYIKGQAIVLDPEHPSWLSFHAVPETGEKVS